MNKIVSYLLILLFASSCATKKVAELDFSVPPKNSKEVISRVNSKNNTPEWLFLKGKINIKKGGQNISLGISIKHRKDSLIWASVSAPFGIELLRTVLTKDSVFYVNRTNKTYFKKPISHILNVVKTKISCSRK